MAMMTSGVSGGETEMDKKKGKKKKNEKKKKGKKKGKVEAPKLERIEYNNNNFF